MMLIHPYWYLKNFLQSVSVTQHLHLHKVAQKFSCTRLLVGKYQSRKSRKGLKGI